MRGEKGRLPGNKRGAKKKIKGRLVLRGVPKCWHEIRQKCSVFMAFTQKDCVTPPRLCRIRPKPALPVVARALWQTTLAKGRMQEKRDGGKNFMNPIKKVCFAVACLQ